MNEISVTTKDEIILTGLISESSESKTAYIYLAGYMDDCKNNVLAKIISEKLIACDQTILLPTSRGTGNITAFYTTDGKEKIIGSYYELLEESHLDISAWIMKLTELGYNEFVLTGHSLGSIKAVRYLFEGEYANLIKKIVLLSPYDKNGYLEERHPKEWKGWVEECKVAVNTGRGREETPKYFDDDPMSYQTYYSWYNEGDLSCMFDFYRRDYDFPILKKIEIPVEIVVGDFDEFFFLKTLNKDIDEVKCILKNNIKKCEFSLISGAGHMFEGFEKDVAEIVCKNIV